MTSLLEKIISIIAPHRCILCGNDNNLLCRSCARGLPQLPEQNCIFCNLASSDSAICASCLPRSPLTQLCWLGIYDQPLRPLVRQLKYHGGRQVAQDVAAAWHDRWPLPPGCLIAHVPTTDQRARQRSYDQAQLLAQQLARQAQLKPVNLLSRRGQTAQVGATRQQRLQQAKAMFQLRPGIEVQGRQVILVDDVFTTGASLLRCATLLRAAGAAQVTGYVIARRMV